MVRRSGRTGLLVLAAMLLAAPASAQIVQSIQIGGGYFWPRGFESRVSGDVLVENLITADPLEFLTEDCLNRTSSCTKAFRNWTVSGEWNFAFGDRIEVSGGVGYYGKNVPSRYRDTVNGHFTETTADDTDIEQTISLRTVPITGIVRFLPVGRASSFQPYVGAGVAVIPFRYSEVGEFVDTTDGTIFPQKYVATGTGVGPVIVFGMRVPVKGDIYGFTTEWRHQWATGNISGLDEFGNPKFLSDKIDLGGGTLNFGFLMRF
jgi:hypothetical protein